MNCGPRRLFPCQHFLQRGIMGDFSRMPAPSKFTVAKVARYVLPFVKPLTLGLLDLKDGTTKELLDAGLDLFGEETGEKIKDYLKTEPDAASGLIDEHLVRHTGGVLGTLVKRYAKEEAVKEYRADLLKLAKVTPGAWAEFLASGELIKPALRKDALNRQLSAALDPHAAAPALEPTAFVEFFRWLAVQKELLGPLKPGLTPPLTKWITRRLNAQILVDLCRDTPQANAAFKESVVRFLTSVQTEAAGAHREAKGAHQKTKAVLKETRKLSKKVDDAIRSTSAETRLAAYKRSLLSAFSAYQELALDNYASAEQASPDIWDIFVHPACSQNHLRPEDMDAAQMEKPPRKPATDLLPLLAQDDHRRTVLLADPGMGKSTLIQSLIAHLASGRPLAGAPALSGLLPVPLILRDLVPLLPQDQVESWTWDSLLTVLLEHYQREETAPPLCEAYKGHEAEFRQLIHSGDCIFFLIDGLDEIGDLVKRRKISDCIQEGIQAASNEARWLITSRVIGYESAPIEVVPCEEIHSMFAEAGDSIVTPIDELDLRNAFIRWVQAWGALFLEGQIKDHEEALLALNPGLFDDNKGISPRYRGRIGFEDVYSARIAQRLYLAPFDNSRQDDFASKWFQKRHSTDHSRELMREVRAHHHEGVRIISRVPNLLCMMNMLKRSGKPLPDGRAALYDEIVKAYLGTIDSAYKFKPIHGHTCPFETTERRHLLALLGAHMQRWRTVVGQKQREKGKESQIDVEQEAEGHILISVPELQMLLIPAIEAMQQSGKVKSDHSAAKLLDELLDHIASRSGLLIPRSTDAEANTVYGFTHLSFMEFFAAEWLGKEFDRLQKRLARRAEAMVDGLDLTEANLDQEFPAPQSIEHKRADFPLVAATPVWHEPLIFLLESRKNDAPTLLRWLFPALHAPAPKLGASNLEPETPLLPIEAVKLALQLAHDQELAISPATRQSWWRTLWTAYLAWPHHPWVHEETKRWPIASLLLERSEHRAEVLQSLSAAYQSATSNSSTQFALENSHRPPALYLTDCDKLTSADFSYLSGLERTEKLDISGCSGLEVLPDLNAMQGLRSLILMKCTGLIGSQSLTGIIGLAHLETLDIDGCTRLKDLPDLRTLTGLRTLSLSSCTSFTNSENIVGLTGMVGLEKLNLSNCTELVSLPNLRPMRGLRSLYLNGCAGLTGHQSLNGLLELEELERLDLNRCSGLDSLPDLSAMQGLRSLYLSGCVGLLGDQAFSGFTRLVGLEKLDLSLCTGLECLPDLTAMHGLRMLDLHRCTGLRDRQALIGLTKLAGLEKLNLEGCTGLEDLPDFRALQSLRRLYLGGCMSLKELGKLKQQLHPDCEIIRPDGERL